MAHRVVPLGGYDPSLFNDNALMINDDAVVARDSSPRIVFPDNVDEHANEESKYAKTLVGYLMCFAILAVGAAVAAVVTVKARTSANPYYNAPPSAEDESSVTGDTSSAPNSPNMPQNNPGDGDLGVGGHSSPCFIGGVLFACASDLRVSIPDCVVESYHDYKKNWIPHHDPTFDYEIDSCAPANLGLITTAAKGMDHISDVQKYALTTFFMSLSGQAWFRYENWLSQTHLEEWDGLEVNSTSNEIVGIDLSNNFLDGTLPEQLGLLSNLKYLRLDGNKIAGSIPWQYGVFEELSIASNSLTGTIPEKWNTSPSLKSLLLDSNLLTGPVPHMAHLEKLSLSRNALTSTITLSTNLNFLNIAQNSLSGTLQENLGTSLVTIEIEDNPWDENPFPLEALKNFPLLEYLHVGNSRLTGTIPTEIGMCRNLIWLEIGRNQLTGTLPTELGLLTQLEIMDLELNALNRTIPSEIGNMDALEVWDASRNDLTGALPTELGRLTNLRFFMFVGNDLSGVIPNEVCTLWDVGALDQFGDVDTRCRDSAYGGVSCPSSECCRNCPGVDTVSVLIEQP